MYPPPGAVLGPSVSWTSRDMTTLPGASTMPPRSQISCFVCNSVWVAWDGLARHGTQGRGSGERQFDDGWRDLRGHAPEHGEEHAVRAVADRSADGLDQVGVEDAAEAPPAEGAVARDSASAYVCARRR